MAKLTLTDITTTNIVTTYNANNDLIEAAIENTLSRDGTTPNQMQADLDMNSNDILNVGNITLANGSQVATTLPDTILDHSTISVLAGTGLTGGGTIDADSTLSLDTTNARNADHSAISITAGVGLTGGGTLEATRNIDLDITELDSMAVATVVGTDTYLVNDGGTMKEIAYNDAHLEVLTVTGTTDTLADTDCNCFLKYTNASAVTVTLPTGVGGEGSVITIGQWGAGQVTVSASGTTLRAPNGAKTAAQYSVIQLICVATDEWVVAGDATA